jgi:hypothetical protein
MLILQQLHFIHDYKRQAQDPNKIKNDLYRKSCKKRNSCNVDSKSEDKAEGDQD